MWNAVELAEGFRYAKEYGFNIEVRGHDFSTLKTARDNYVKRLNSIYKENLSKKKIRHVSALARISGPGEVMDSNGQRYRAPHIIIATGGRPRRPDIDGQQFAIDSDRFFDLESLPARVAVVGSGYISVELAGVLHALGSSVSILVRRDALLRSFDSMLGSELMSQMSGAGIEIVTDAVPTRIRNDNGLTIETASTGSHAGFDSVLFAIGRDPNTSELGLESTTVELRQSGHIIVDEFQNTAEAGIYAIGDVTGQAELTPVAIAAGRRLADRLFDGQSDRRLNYELIPTVIFSHPPIGTIGLSEEDARQRYGADVKIYNSRFVGMFNAITESRPATAMKLVVAGPDERVVGCHVIGAGADEMMQGFAVAMSLGARKRDFDDTIAIHPTSSEELVTMR
jgi:glutathione reductase (NADPH)